MNSTTHRPSRLLICARIGMVASACTLSFAGLALAQTVDKKDDSPWSVRAGLGLASKPEYEGGSKTVSGLVPSLNIAYRTDSYGTFSLGTEDEGIRWTVIDKDDYSFGVSLGMSSSRIDTKDGTLFKPGSTRLKGMGEIKSAAEFGVFGSVTLGIPIMLQVSKSAGDGTADSADRSIRGHSGTQVELSTEIPWQITNNLGLSFSPNIMWADKKYNQAFFGVTRLQAGNSGFSAYNAESGIKSVGVKVGLNYKITPDWSANVMASFDQLQGDAANSPLVQKKGQAAVAAIVSYSF
jgi:MipA family protein